jgi:hypothetical protein
MRGWIAAGGLLALAGCAVPDAQVPPFARVPYEAFSRDSVVAIALREWRLFGQIVDDDEAAPMPVTKSERAPGMWQRIGEYWWLGLDTTQPESRWTGKHDENGRVFPEARDGSFAWSAAFVSYVMRISGAGARFPYSANHWTYIDRARAAADGKDDAIVVAERPETYAPRPGDLICLGRGKAAALRYEHLPAGPFPAHCDIVVETTPARLAVVGGNVRDGVTLKHVPVTPDGKLAGPDGAVLDTQRPWMVVLRLRVPGSVS